VPKPTPSVFQKLVLNWFDRFGRKNFPWQQNKTPYRVWVSEIMLQQTQVTTVIPYFERFLKQFPDLPSLAKAKEDEVLHLWTGLGYYSRARNLHRTAKLIHQAGKFPDTLEELQKLPGIGRSTAGAIISCAFDKKAAILDGNVKRLLARFHAVTDPIDDKKTQDHLWELSEEYTPSKRVADYTQVMMDLGATLCTRSKPRCPECPVATYCKAKQENLAEQLPYKKKKGSLPIRQTTFLILRSQDEVLLQKRPSKGIWGGLWSLPEIPEKATVEQIKSFCLEQFELHTKALQPLKPFRHTFSHFHLEIFPIELKTSRPKIMVSKTQIWYSLRRPETLGLPAPILSLLGNLS
jgi:A/G-specific adenine glycosylase